MKNEIQQSVEVLNDFRNLYHTDGTATERGRLALAINDILPLFAKMIDDYDETHTGSIWFSPIEIPSEKNRVVFEGIGFEEDVTKIINYLEMTDYITTVPKGIVSYLYGEYCQNVLEASWVNISNVEDCKEFINWLNSCQINVVIPANWESL